MPSATARDFQRVARLLRFVLTRQTGSPERWNHPDGRAVTIPVHGGGEIGPPLIFKILAIDLHLLHSISFWDALIVRCASAAGCVRLLTEDLNHGQRIDGVQIE